MAKPPQYPLLRLDPPKPGDRQKRKGGFGGARQYDPTEQANRPPGQRLQRLAQAFAEGRDPLELRDDAAGLAPERLLVFELTTDVQNFARAAAQVPGLEFVGAEELEGDELDKAPALYLLIPDAAALRQMVGLWNRYRAGGAWPEGFAPWRNLFAQLRDLRPWGPQDRVSPEDAEILAEERADERGMVRIELELVFRATGEAVEQEALAVLRQSGGELVSQTRIGGAKYHALLVDVPKAELRRVLERGHEGLVAAEAVMHIRPQSAVHITAFEDEEANRRPPLRCRPVIRSPRSSMPCRWPAIPAWPAGCRSKTPSTWSPSPSAVGSMEPPWRRLCCTAISPARRRRRLSAASSS